MNKLTLAAKLETASPQDQHDLLDEAFRAIHGEKPARVTGGSPEWLAWLALYSPFHAMLRAKAYESAALTLVPSGWSVLAAWNPTGRCKCDLSDGPMDGENREWVGAEPCSTPAYAITAASLKVHAQNDRSPTGPFRNEPEKINVDLID